MSKGSRTNSIQSCNHVMCTFVEYIHTNRYLRDGHAQIFPTLVDALTVSLASAFLLNTHSYQQLATLDHPFIPGKVHVLSVEIIF